MAATEQAPQPESQAKASPGAQLRVARQAAGLSEREAADRLKWLPCYIGIIERDDYQALRRPAFARGYIRAYGRLLGVDETALLAAFDELEVGGAATAAGRKAQTPAAPGKVSRTAIVLCLVLLALVLAGLWWKDNAEHGQAALQTSQVESPHSSEL